MKPRGPLDCGNSGTTMRLLSGLLAAQDFVTDLTGDASLCKRPMDRVARPLEQMGARMTMTGGKFPPLTINGTRNLKPIDWKNPVSSAQVKSAVLLAALHTIGETIYEEPFLSRDHTERMLSACGVNVRREGARIRLAGPARLKAQTWRVPGDFSSAAFFIAAALLVKESHVTLESVNLNPTRTGFLSVLTAMGAAIDVANSNDVGGEPVGNVIVRGPARLKGITLKKADVPHLIDEIPLLAVVATQAQGTTVLDDVGELRVKESDRIHAMVQNLSSMGASIKETETGMIIAGPTPLHGAVVDSCCDHRIAMSMAVAGLIASGETHINQCECVSISFPQFWETLDTLK